LTAAVFPAWSVTRQSAFRWYTATSRTSDGFSVGLLGCPAAEPCGAVISAVFTATMMPSFTGSVKPPFPWRAMTAGARSGGSSLMPCRDMTGDAMRGRLPGFRPRLPSPPPKIAPGIFFAPFWSLNEIRLSAFPSDWSRRSPGTVDATSDPFPAA
jgi:hypothetical protein